MLSVVLLGFIRGEENFSSLGMVPVIKLTELFITQCFFTSTMMMSGFTAQFINTNLI